MIKTTWIVIFTCASKRPFFFFHFPSSIKLTKGLIYLRQGEKSCISRPATLLWIKSTTVNKRKLLKNCCMISEYTIRVYLNIPVSLKWKSIYSDWLQIKLLSEMRGERVKQSFKYILKYSKIVCAYVSRRGILVLIAGNWPQSSQLQIYIVAKIRIFFFNTR